MLTGKELTIALVKAASSQIPVAGSFISEAIGAIDQKNTVLELENRINALENILLNFGFIEINSDSIKRTNYHVNSNYEKIMHEFQQSLTSSESFENYIVSIEKTPSPEFLYSATGLKIKIIHDIFVTIDRPGITVTSIARDALISFSSKVILSAKLEDDFIINYTKSTDSDELREFGYLAAAWNGLGRNLLQATKYHDAIMCFARAIELGDEPLIPLLNIANCFYNMGHIDYALTKYRTLVKMYPYGTDVRYRLASTLEKMGNIKEAKKHYKAIVDNYNNALKKGATYSGTPLMWVELSQKFIKDN